MYSLGEPTGEAKVYLEWIFSEAGQKIVEDNGYVPLPQDLREMGSDSSGGE
jgi:ABC-type phosphate transport system substrate-binding protein